jgi:hypothetical protein
LKKYVTVLADITIPTLASIEELGKTEGKLSFLAEFRSEYPNSNPGRELRDLYFMKMLEQQRAFKYVTTTPFIPNRLVWR